MTITVDGTEISKIGKVAIALRHNSLTSTISFSALFNPFSQSDKETFLPGAFRFVQVEHNGKVMFKGILTSIVFRRASTISLVECSGYSMTGALERVTAAKQSYPLEFSNLNLIQIIKKLIDPFGLKVIFADLVFSDENLFKDANTPYVNATLKEDEKIAPFLTKLASQKNIVLSHDMNGNIIMTRGNGKQTPIAHFSESMPNVEFSLKFDGQDLHDTINVQQQSGISGTAGDNTIVNPYVIGGGQINAPILVLTNPYSRATFLPKARPITVMQTAGNENSTPLTARAVLGEELRATGVTIEMQGWDVNGTVITPNNVISIISPFLYLYQKTGLFVEAVTYEMDTKKTTCKIDAVVKEVYNNIPVVNIFTGSNLTVIPEFEPMKLMELPDWNLELMIHT